LRVTQHRGKIRLHGQVGQVVQPGENAHFGKLADTSEKNQFN
jgi:hypothetical protein